MIFHIQQTEETGAEKQRAREREGGAEREELKRERLLPLIARVCQPNHLTLPSVLQ